MCMQRDCWTRVPRRIIKSLQNINTATYTATYNATHTATHTTTHSATHTATHAHAPHGAS